MCLCVYVSVYMCLCICKVQASLKIEPSFLLRKLPPILPLGIFVFPAFVLVLFIMCTSLCLHEFMCSTRPQWPENFRELQAVLCCLINQVGTEPGSSEKAVSTPTLLKTKPALQSVFQIFASFKYKHRHITEST